MPTLANGSSESMARVGCVAFGGLAARSLLDQYGFCLDSSGFQNGSSAVLRAANSHGAIIRHLSALGSE
jgi:hypothetical protein